VAQVDRRDRIRDGKVASRGYFDDQAGRYEASRRWRRLRKPQLQTIAALELAGDDRLLAVGCGSGAGARAAAALAVGLDLSPGMIEQARRLAEGIDNVEFVVGDSESLRFLDGEFSAVVCTTSIHHYPRPEVAVAEMARVLAPGGRLAIGDFNPEQLVVRALDHRFKRREPGQLGFHSPDQLAGYLTDAGLTDVTVHRLHRQGFAVVLAHKR